MRVVLKDAPEVAAVLARSHGYRTATECELEVFKGPQTCGSNWSGGSRSDWTLVNLSTGDTLPLPSDSGTAFSERAPVLESLPAGFALVQCSMFRGKRMPATVYVNAETLNRLALPAPVADLSYSERVTLWVTEGLKSFARKQEATRGQYGNPGSGITEEEYEAARLSLATKGLLTKQGAITAAGRNVNEAAGRKPGGCGWPKKA